MLKERELCSSDNIFFIPRNHRYGISAQNIRNSVVFCVMKYLIQIAECQGKKHLHFGAFERSFEICLSTAFFPRRANSSSCIQDLSKQLIDSFILLTWDLTVSQWKCAFCTLCKHVRHNVTYIPFFSLAPFHSTSKLRVSNRTRIPPETKRYEIESYASTYNSSISQHKGGIRDQRNI